MGAAFQAEGMDGAGAVRKQCAGLQCMEIRRKEVKMGLRGHFRTASRNSRRDKDVSL